MYDPNLDEERNSVLGELDYMNSYIGLAKSLIKNRQIRSLLTAIQNDIFILQAHIASPENVLCLPRGITQGRIFDLQKETFLIERYLPKLNHFIIPEGVTAACLFHCLRSIARNIERQIPGYLGEPTIVGLYLDCIAGLFFALARYVNRVNGFKEKPPAYFLINRPQHSRGLAAKGGRDGRR